MLPRFRGASPAARQPLPPAPLAPASWTILGAVEELDLSAFYGAYRADGHGRPAFEPSMMVALLLYSYSKGNRSSRAIERACREDVAYGDQRPAGARSLDDRGVPQAPRAGVG
jgi:hypothetical protein